MRLAQRYSPTAHERQAKTGSHVGQRTQYVQWDESQNLLPFLRKVWEGIIARAEFITSFCLFFYLFFFFTEISVCGKGKESRQR